MREINATRAALCGLQSLVFGVLFSKINRDLKRCLYKSGGFDLITDSYRGEEESIISSGAFSGERKYICGNVKKSAVGKHPK